MCPEQSVHMSEDFSHGPDDGACPPDHIMSFFKEYCHRGEDATGLVMSVIAQLGGEIKDEHLEFLTTLQKARNGDVNMQVELAHMYKTGKGVRRDLKQALVWYERAAMLGCTDAMNSIGVLYQKGLTLPDGGRDYRKAFEWYERAAVAGNIWAMANLAFMLQNGRGTDVDVKTAGIWYQRAAAAGNKHAMFKWSMFLRCGLGGVDVDAEASDVYLKRAYSLGDDEARRFVDNGMREELVDLEDVDYDE